MCVDMEAFNCSGSFVVQARDVYEEAILTVVTVRDFTQVFDSYAQFEESMIAAKMETTAEMGQDEEGVLRFHSIGSGIDCSGPAHVTLGLFPLQMTLTWSSDLPALRS